MLSKAKHSYYQIRELSITKSGSLPPSKALSFGE